MKPRILEIHQGVLTKNDQIATQLREDFMKHRILVINLVSSPGAGKTVFLRETLMKLREQGLQVCALVGDLETDNDAKQLALSGAPVRQIRTAGSCHLEAQVIGEYLQGWDLASFDFLFIENVGNLVCPANFDLGESLRVVLLSTTEGEDKPLKYPQMFHSADVAVITKIDLADVVEFDHQALYHNLQAVHPAMPVFEVSAKTGVGMSLWFDYLKNVLQNFHTTSTKV